VLRYDEGGSPDPVTGPEDDFDLPGAEKVTMHVIGDVQLTAGSSVTSGFSDRSNRFRMVLHQPKKGVFLNSGSVFEGSIVAPGARVVLAPRTGFVGSVYARFVDVSALSAFRSHRHGEELPLATLPGSKIRTPGPDDGASTLLAESETPGVFRFALSQNLPNPVRRSTAIRFALSERREVRLEVFDVGGRLVRTLANGVMPAGAHTRSWNGTNERGRRVASGVYLYRLVSGRDVAQRKMIVLD